MTAQRFTRGQRIRFDQTTYEIARVLEGGRVQLEDLGYGAERTCDIHNLIQALFDGNLEFDRVGHRATPRIPACGGRGNSDGRTTERHYLDLSEVPELKAIAEFRWEVIRPLLALPPAERTRAAVQARVEETQAAQTARDEPPAYGQRVSVASVYRWIRLAEQSGHDWRALIPNTRQRGGKHKGRLSPEVEAIIQGVLQDKLYQREQVTVEIILCEVAARVADENQLRAPHEQLQTPTRSSIVRRIEAQDLRARFTARHGPRAARRQFTQYGQAEQPTHPLERVEIDHTKADLIVIDDQDNLPLGRLTVSYCLDIATRYPLGYYLGFEPPSYLAVMECLYHAVRPKESTSQKYQTQHEWTAYGVPATLVADNAKEFIGQDLLDACGALGILLQHTPVLTPHFKPGVERLLGSLNTMFLHTLPGTTFSNPQQRGDYNSLEMACVTLTELEKMLNIFIVDIYAQRLHKGLGDLPAVRWDVALQGGFTPRVPASAQELWVLLGRVAYRTIQAYGIEFLSLRYNSPDLSTLRNALSTGEKVKIKYHPGDLSRIFVHDPLTHDYVEVPALDQEYTQGLSLWKHQVIRNAVLRTQPEVDLAALGRARRQIQEMVEAARSRRSTSTRSRIARWDEPDRRTARAEGQGTLPASQTAPPLPPAPQPALSPPTDLKPTPTPVTAEGQPDEGWAILPALPKRGPLSLAASTKGEKQHVNPK